MTIDKSDIALKVVELTALKLKVLQKSELSESAYADQLEVIAKEVEMYCFLAGGVLKVELVGMPPKNSPPENIWDEMCLYLMEYGE